MKCCSLGFGGVRTGVTEGINQGRNDWAYLNGVFPRGLLQRWRQPLLWSRFCMILCVFEVSSCTYHALVGSVPL